MSVAKVLEITSRSPQSFDAAISEGIKKASETVHGIQEAWVKDMVVEVAEAAVVGYKVNLKVTFLVD